LTSSDLIARAVTMLPNLLIEIAADIVSACVGKDALSQPTCRTCACRMLPD
jgi:hypothetical protein